MKRFDPRAVPYIRWLIYGIPGSTKTRTAFTAAMDERTSPCLALNVAGNPISARDFAKMPDVVEIDTMDDFNTVYNWLRAGQNPDAAFAKQFDLRPPYKCLVIDTITEAQRISFNKVTDSLSVGPGGYPSRVERQHFGTVLAQMVNFARLFYALPMHVIITSQEKEEKDEQTGAITCMPLLWGQSDVEVGGYAYLVSRMVHRSTLSAGVLKVLETADPSVVSVALFKPSGKYVAKDQYGMRNGVSFVDQMINPTVGKVLDLIYGPVK